MTWGFETEPEYQTKLDWVQQFVKDEVEPLELVLGHPADVRNPRRAALVKPLQAVVRRQGLWACHLGQELGGQGYGQVKLGLLNEILGGALYGPSVFGCQAPDSGNAEILAHYGTPEQKKKYLEPLLNNDIVSCFAMTEPQGGADPGVFKTRAVRKGDNWVINGEKWFASHARYAEFLIVMAVTDPDAPVMQRMSMFIVPTKTPGLKIIHDYGFATEKEPNHGHLEFDEVMVPHDAMLGKEGDAFVVAQVRLGGGRIHHAMRTIGEARRALNMMCERVISRSTKGELLANKQMVQEKIADSWIELEQFRLLVLRTAWLVDKHKDYKKVRKDISAIKAMMPKVLHDIASRALHLHGSLGITQEMPFTHWVMQSFHIGLADGPVEVHKVTVAKQLLREFKPSQTQFPSYHLHTRREAALAKYKDALERIDNEI
jgi:acyl-CoA dehydrogenase